VNQRKEKNFLDCVVKLLQIDELEYEYRTILSELRYLLLLRGKSLTKQKMIISFINEGRGFMDLKLEEMCRITRSNYLNKKIPTEHPNGNEQRNCPNKISPKEIP
jgi:hypothetical protein